MTAVKKLALSVCVLGSMSTSVYAGPMSRSGSSRGWITWISNRTSSDNGGYTVSGPSTLNVFSATQTPPAPAAPAPAALPATISGSGTLSLSTSYTPTPTAVSAPAPAPVPVMLSAPAISNADQTQAPVASTVALAVPPAATADAYIDLYGGPYANSSLLTTGGAQAWYISPSAIQAFGGIPNAQQQASFDQAVLAHVQQTFQLSGMNPTITLDPTVSALHTISVVSNTSNPTDPNALGMTEVGGSGFGYIDKLSPLNLTSDQLAWAVAHNVSHELMHAFGIGTHPDQTGTYLDSASATVAVLTDPNTTFSPAADQLIKATDYGVDINGGGIGAEKLTMNPNHVGPKCNCIFCRGIFGGASTGTGAQALESPVPEPSTILVWGSTLVAAGFVLRRNRKVGQAS